MILKEIDMRGFAFGASESRLVGASKRAMAKRGLTVEFHTSVK